MSFNKDSADEGVPMGTITKIEKQKNDGSRVNVFIDSVFKSGLDGFIALKHRLKAGQKISDEDFNEIIVESDGQKAFEKALSILTKRPKTEKQIRQYLKEKEYAAAAVESAVEKLYYYNYLNDKSYCESFVSFHKKEWGVKRLKIELRQDGVADEIIEEVLSESGNQAEEAYLLAAKYVSRKEFNKDKIFNFLYSKGFLSDDISKAVSKLKSELENNGEE